MNAIYPDIEITAGNGVAAGAPLRLAPPRAFRYALRDHVSRAAPDAWWTPVVYEAGQQWRGAHLIGFTLEGATDLASPCSLAYRTKAGAVLVTVLDDAEREQQGYGRLRIAQAARILAANPGARLAKSCLALDARFPLPPATTLVDCAEEITSCRTLSSSVFAIECTAYGRWDPDTLDELGAALSSAPAAFVSITPRGCRFWTVTATPIVDPAAYSIAWHAAAKRIREWAAEVVSALGLVISDVHDSYPLLGSSALGAIRVDFEGLATGALPLAPEGTALPSPGPPVAPPPDVPSDFGTPPRGPNRVVPLP